MISRRDFLLSGAAVLALNRAAFANLGRNTAAFPNSGNLAKFEPAHGCYIGAFIERDTHVMGNIGAFEELTKRKHASYFTYVGYGRPFPAEWVRKVARAGGARHIAFEPNNGLDEVQDSLYLRA